MDHIPSLPNSDAAIIQKFIDLKNKDIQRFAENAILREDIFQVLEGFATVIFYPYDDDIDGMHVMRMVKMEEKNFIFINSNKPMEKQIFTAAHELGHLLKLDEYYSLQRTERIIDSDFIEKLMNRFAAMLLMPKESFQKKFSEKKEALNFSMDSVINAETLLNLMRIVASLMDEFFVPSKAIFIRFAETDLMTPLLVNKFLDDSISQKIDSILEHCAKESGYCKLFSPSRTKGSPRLTDMLIQAENRRIWSQSKIDAIRKKLDIESPTPIINDDIASLSKVISESKGDNN